ncbi:MAG: IS66 family insertion sequence element accessory protein TnpB [bacterium]|nr:IS66 family insertion sequence element accessory protein TnpB [bacterium]
MFNLNAYQNYYLYAQATDMRKGFNGLSGLVRDKLGKNPLSGDVFIFVNRRRDRMKVLVWESGGFVLYYKLLESGTFELPQTASNSASCTISWHQLVLIMEGVELESVKKRKRFNFGKTG